MLFAYTVRGLFVHTASMGKSGGMPVLKFAMLYPHLIKTATLVCSPVKGPTVPGWLDHMDRYGSVAEYVTAKARIFGGCAVAVINADDPLVRGMLRAGQRDISFGLADADAD